jgi:hypothetical protein
MGKDADGLTLELLLHSDVHVPAYLTGSEIDMLHGRRSKD